MLRVECTANDVTFFKHHRWVEHRDGELTYKLAAMKKTIYSLSALRKLMAAANGRYIAFLASLDAPDIDPKSLDKMAKPVRDSDRPYRGFNLFLAEDYRLFLEIARGQWCISGFRSVDLRARIPGLSPSNTSHLLKRLRTHGIIKKVAHRYRYHLTAFGRRVVASALAIREFAVIPKLCAVNA